MTLPVLFRRTARQRPTLVIEMTQHWRFVDGVTYRDCLVELPDGTRAVRGVRDDLLVGAA